MQEFDKNSIIDGDLAFDIAAVEVKAASERCQTRKNELPLFKA
jgi:hypothetical protein